MDNRQKINWTLREALFTAFHNWPLLLAGIILGSVVGWGLSFVWPSYYRASSDIYIGLNPYRKFSDANFEALANPKYSNLDNYHYWQMSQLNSAIQMDTYLQATLDRLRQAGPAWQSVTVEQLRAMLAIEWRSSGTWSLIANPPDSRSAQQAARAWSDVVVELVPQAVNAARDTFRIDQQLQANEDALLQATLRQRDLASAGQTLQGWQNAAQKEPPDSAVAPAQRWQLLAAVSGLADFSPAWMDILHSQPGTDAKAQAYLDWIAQTLPFLESEKEALRQRLVYLNQQQVDLAEQYAQASQKSLGFSPNIEIQRKEDHKPLKMRPESTLILVGAVTGLLLGILSQLVIITRARSRV